MTVTVERETRLDRAAEARFAAIYEDSFPPEERDDTGDLVASIHAGERLCFLARRDGDVVGLAVVFRLNAPRVAFLEYLAVAPGERDAGIGSSMFAHLEKNLRAGAGEDVGIVLEVEPPDDADGPERVLRERRIAFYVRHGAVVVDCAPRYRAPSLVRADETIGFMLLWLPLARDAPTRLEGTFLRTCVESILTESYGLRAGDPLVREVVLDLAC